MLFRSTNGIIYRGTLEHSQLQGALFVNNADVTFPLLKGTEENSSSVVPLIVIDDTTKSFPFANLLTPQHKSSKGKAISVMNNEQKPLGDIILDGMMIDLTIETKGSTQLRMIFSNNPATSEELYAELNGKLVARKTTEGIRFLGDIDIGEQSYYNFFKRFAARGKLRFTGNPQNPELDIVATYQGIHTSYDTIQTQRDQKILVTLNIAGTRNEPKINIGMKELSGQDTVDFATKGKDPQSDAISFLFTGKYRDELTSGERSQLVQEIGSSVSTSVLTGYTSSVLSGMLSEYLRNEFSFIRSAEISYAGGNISNEADVRLSGEVFNAYWRFGGRILNDIGRANVSFQIPVGEMVKSKALQNLFIEVERKVEDETFVSERKLTNTARLFYKFSY